MIARVIYEGQLGETIMEVLPELVKKAQIVETYFYLVWNGVYLVVSPRSTVDGLLDEYERKISQPVVR